jgi:hypothetical protein
MTDHQLARILAQLHAVWRPRNFSLPVNQILGEDKNHILTSPPYPLNAAFELLVAASQWGHSKAE